MSREVHFGNGSVGLALGKGQIKLVTAEGDIFLEHVLYIPSLTSNLLSLSSLISQGHSVYISGGTEDIHIYHSGAKIATASLTEGIYVLNSPPQHVCNLANGESTAEAEPAAESIAMQWHRKLRHTKFGTLANKKRKGMLPDCSATPPEILKARDEETCDSCMEGKMHRSSHPARQTPTPHLNFRVHSDLMGPLKTSTISGARYVLTLIDELSGFSVVKLISHKSDVLTELPILLQQFITQGGRPIKRLRTDNGGEYMSTALKVELDKPGIWHETTSAYTPE